MSRRSIAPREVRVGCSPLSNNIYAGRLCVDGHTWQDGKQDVTIDALVAVAEHVERFGQSVKLYGRPDAPSYEIAVRRLNESESSTDTSAGR